MTIIQIIVLFFNFTLLIGFSLWLKNNIARIAVRSYITYPLQ